MVVSNRRLIASPLALLLSVALILSTTAYFAAQNLSNPQRGPRDGAWERIQANGYILIGIDPSIPPFGQIENDEVMGFDPSLGQAMAAELGLEARFVVLGFDGLYDSLLVGQVDIVIAALRPDPLRLDRVRYTSPYFDAGQVLVSEAGWQHLEDLEGKQVGVEFASEGDLAVRQVADIRLMRFFTAEEALQSILQGKTEAAVVDRVTALLFLRPHPQLQIHTLVPDPYVMAVRRTDWRLFGALETALLKVKNRGVLENLTQEWLQ